MATGANKIYRDGGDSTIRLNTVTRGDGASLYFDLARIATVDNTNKNNILGGWAIIRDAVAHASWSITGTVSRQIVANPGTDVFSVATLAMGFHYLPNGTPVRLTTIGTLPVPLETNKTYYVTNAGTRTFKLSEELYGPPVNLRSAGSPGTDQHTVSTYLPQRPGQATLTFTANPNNYAGVQGNDLFEVQIVNVPTPGDITYELTGSLPQNGNPGNLPLKYKIITTSNHSSADEIVNFVNSTEGGVSDYLSASSSGGDNQLDMGSYGPQLLQGGSNDTGAQDLGWARIRRMVLSL